MRALFVIHTLKDPQTAVFKVVSEQAEALRERCHHVEILAPEDFAIMRLVGPRFNPLLFPILIAGWLVFCGRHFDLIKFHSYGGWILSLLRSTLGRSRTTRIVTEFHGLEPLYFAVLEEEARLSGQRLSRRYRLVNGWFMNRILRIACRLSDRVLCLNTSELDFLAKHEWAIAPQLSLFKNVAPSAFFEIRRNYLRKPTTLLFVGQWNECKGIRYLIDAFSQTASENPNLQLLCAGTLRDAHSVLLEFPVQIRDRVQVQPRFDRDMLRYLHTTADIFVFPSLFEGSSLALLEAMASGLPIITTPVGAAPDILKDHTSALFVPPRDSSSLAAAIRTLVGDLEMRAVLGANARAAAESHRSTSAVAQNASLLEELALDSSKRVFTPEQISAVPVRN